MGGDKGNIGLTGQKIVVTPYGRQSLIIQQHLDWMLEVRK